MGSARTLLCVSIMVRDEATALADARAAKDAGAELVEFRVDEVFTGTVGGDAGGNLDQREVSAILRIVAGSPVPCIVTCRLASEGGHYDGDEAARLALYERLGTAGNGASGVGGEHPPRYLDIEFAAYARSANLRQKVHLAVDWPAQRRERRPGLILSMHDFNGRPPDLLRRLGLMQAEEAARITKVAYQARSVRDNLELFDLLSENAAGRPMIALGMGPFGLMSRVLAPKFGGFLTFASLRGGQSATAPGQPTVQELLEVYRFRSINAKTRVYGIVGWPVEHSLSPVVHNAGFESLETDDWEDEGGRGGTEDKVGVHDAVYLPLPVPPEYEHFKATVLALVDHPKLDFCGCSVTLPHKQHLVRLARERMEAGDEIGWELDEVSAACGAGNTLVVERDWMGNARRARVINTDARAAAGVLASVMGGSIVGKRVAVIGAGGAGRAVAAGLLLGGATVVVYNRTAEAAELVASELGGTKLVERGGKVVGMGLDAMGRTCADAIVNCTPVGMTGGPAPGESPVDLEVLRNGSPEAVVMDTVYAPLETPLLRQASLAGFRTIDGLAMFVRQAGEQFTAWTGASAPLQLFERVAREELRARQGRG